jgi:uncharacterized ferritin-like protein (DUF455 family)
MAELRELALGLLNRPDLTGKLARFPADWTDDAPGPPTRIDRPARSPELTIRSSREVKVPPVEGMADPTQRARILHALANHELQAAELFAWALLAFPDAPPAFRRGLVAILGDEQLHCELYLARLEALGHRFGDHGLTGHFWNKLGAITSPLTFVCTMGLTFENANLDFARAYADAARAAGDDATAAALDRVHADEIRHVRFAWSWLGKLKPADQSAWNTYLASVEWPLGPGRARGKQFDADARRRAGLDDEFIDQLAAAAPKRPSGEPR